MTRLYGRAAKGERIKEHVPDARFQRRSILASARLNGAIEPLVFSGTLNGDLFKQYILEVLAPTLGEGDIVVMDNLSAHKVDGVAALVAAKGARIAYLPPYSPDFNPIESMWSKIKAFLKKTKARTDELLECGIGKALEQVTPEDISGWFEHCHYSKC